MKCLAIDTSGSHLSLLIIDDEKIFKKHIENCNLQHSVIAMQEVENLLLEANLEVKDIDVFACVVGPGSFTGIRIGISMVKAFAFANDKKVLSLTSFDVLAYNNYDGKNLTVIDAKHDNYYVCGYDENKKVILKPQFVNFQTLEAIKNEYDNLLISSTNEKYLKNCDLQEGFTNAVLQNLQNSTYDRESVVALYVRKSQAEESK